MKSTFVILICLAMFLPGQVVAKNKNIGIGVILGDPLRLSVKKWLGTSANAIDGAFSKIEGGGADGGAFEAHVDYLKHDFNMFKINEGSLPVYYGIGIKVINDPDAELETSLRIPLGIAFLARKAPISIFYEYAFLYDISSPDSKLSSETAFGFRYYF